MPTSQTTRIDRRFAILADEGRAALVTFITAGDPDLATSELILGGLAGAGADVIELGMPFSDPMADGPAIQLASQRALKAGQTLAKTLDMVARFRERDNETPIVLMGYYNPIYHMGVERFLERADKAGVDGLIVVDLPPEADDELCLPAIARCLNFIRLATPTTDDARLPAVLRNTSGFVYYVSIMGITGTASPDTERVAHHVRRIKAQTELPVAVGFGVKTPEQAKAIGAVSDGVVVGSALVGLIAQAIDENGTVDEGLPGRVHKLVGELSAALHRD